MKQYTCRQCSIWKRDEADETKPHPSTVFRHADKALEHAVQVHGQRVSDTVFKISGVDLDQLLIICLRDVNADNKSDPQPPVITNVD